MSFGADELYDRLVGDSNITNKIGTYGTNPDPAVFDAKVIPEDYKGSGINFLRTGSVDGGLNYGDYVWTVNCRAATEEDAEAIGEAVFNNLNRYRAGIVCTLFSTIPPIDQTDDYNSPVEVRIKKERG